MSKKTQNALRKYYSAFNYDTGVKAYKRGGNMGFTPLKFTGGGDLLHDPESLYGLYLRGQYGYGKLENPIIITPESTQTLAGGTTLRNPKKSEFDWSGLLEGNQGQASSSLGKNINMSTPWSAIAGTAGSLTVDLQRFIDAQIRKNDKHVYNPLVSAGLAKGGRKFEGGGFSSSPMDIAGSAVKIAANAVNQASLTTDYDVFEDAVNRYTADQISSINGITDNDSLMNAYASMYQLSDNIKGRDFRDKTVLGDITDGLASSFEGFNATGNWIGAVVGGVSSNIGSIIGRIRANKAANRAEELVRKRNQEIDTRLFHASQDVDRRNDLMRMIGFYNDPFEYALGGEMRTHGSDWNNGLTFINAGGRHEENPYEGVPSGVDADGIPNLVEEGEVIWNDEYVFSDRLKVPKELANKYKLGGEKTFAEAIKEVTKESRTRPNDPISNETNRAIVNEFMDAQEALREEEQAKAAQQLQTAYDEDFMNELAAMNQGGMPMQEGIQLPPQGMNEEGMPIEGVPVGFAFGGNKFDDGSWKLHFSSEKDASGNRILVAPDGSIFYSEKAAHDYYRREGSDWITPAIKSVRLTTDGYIQNDSPIVANRINTNQQLDNTSRTVSSKTIPIYPNEERIGHPYVAWQDWNYPWESIQPTAVQPSVKTNIAGYTRPRVAEETPVRPLRDFATGADYTFYGDYNPVERPVTYVGIPTDGSTIETKSTEPAAQEAQSEDTVKKKTDKQEEKPDNQYNGGKPGSKSSKARAKEAENAYRNYATQLDKASDEDKQRFIDDLNSRLPKGKKVKDYAEWKRKAFDGTDGPVHEQTLTTLAATVEARNNRPQSQAVPAGPAKTSAEDVESNLQELRAIINASASNNGRLATRSSGNNRQVSPSVNDAVQRGLFGNTPWERLAPIYATGIMAGNSILNGPDYYNADRIIDAARAAGVPVNIPVQTIGDYRIRRPFDERYLVNMANQNMAAGQRSLYNTSGGNRAMDMLGAMSLAHSNQQTLADIMRQAYLANRADDAQVAEFNRGTNLQNMSAINQRNQAQASLNSQRQTAMLNGLASGYGMRQSVWKDWRDDRDANIEAFVDNLGLRGREKMTDEMALSFAKEMGYNWTYDPNTGKITFVKPSSKGGNKKKRRF